jgi:hypothetical protein
VPEVDSAEQPQSFWVRWLLMVTGMVLIVFVALFAAPLAATFRGFHHRPA